VSLLLELSGFLHRRWRGVWSEMVAHGSLRAMYGVGSPRLCRQRQECSSAIGSVVASDVVERSRAPAVGVVALRRRNVGPSQQ